MVVTDTVDVVLKVEASVSVDVRVVNEVRFCSLVTHLVPVCLKVEVTLESIWFVVVVVDVSRTVWVVTVVAVLWDGTSYTATDAVPIMITIPIANTLTNGEIPPLNVFREKTFSAREFSLVLFLRACGFNP